MNEIISLDATFSTTRQVVKADPKVITKLIKQTAKPDDQFETQVFLKTGENRQGEGGLRTKGYFKVGGLISENLCYYEQCEAYFNSSPLKENISIEENPLITVVTVVYNGEQFLEETILSVINQTYDNVEYIIIDGGSTDGTLNIIKKYEHTIDYWVSEKDRGIYDAMNKSIEIASGDWLLFLNSGDTFNSKSVVEEMSLILEESSEQIISGVVKIVDLQNRWCGYYHPYLSSKTDEKNNDIAHQATFTRKSVFETVGKFNTKYKIQGDFDFFLRALNKNIRVKRINKVISNFLNNGVSSSKKYLVKSILEKNKVLLENLKYNGIQVRIISFKEITVLYIKLFVKKLLPIKLGQSIAQKNFLKTTSETNIIYDTSVHGSTHAGVYTYSINIFKELRKSEKVYIHEFKNPFITVGKKGFNRKVNSLLRLFYQELIILLDTGKSIYFFPAPEIPYTVLLSKKRYYVVIHDLYSFKNPSKTTLFANIKNKLIPIIVDNAELVFTVSEYSKNEIVSAFGIPEQKVKITPNGLDDVFINTDLFIPKSALYKENFFLNVGSLEPRKNIDFLIDLFNFLKQDDDFNDYKLVLTGGEGWKNGLIKDKIESSKHKHDIFVLGSVDIHTLKALYNKSKAVIFPSIEEGFGIPVIESLSQNTPVFVNNNSALSSFSKFGACVIDNYDVCYWKDQIKKHKAFKASIDVDNVINNFNWKVSSEVITMDITN